MEKIKALVSEQEIKDFEKTAAEIAVQLIRSLEYAIKQLTGRRKTVKMNILIIRTGK
jgi:hypothetical protein